MKAVAVDIMEKKEVTAVADITTETVKDAIMDMATVVITNTAEAATTDTTEETAAAATDNRYLYI